MKNVLDTLTILSFVALILFAVITFKDATTIAVICVIICCCLGVNVVAYLNEKIDDMKKKKKDAEDLLQ